MKFIKYFSIVFALISTVACGGDPENFFSPIIDIELPPHKSKLVVFANFEAGADSLILHLTRSRSALDTVKLGKRVYDTIRFPNGAFQLQDIGYISSDTFRNAKVELFRNEVLWGTFSPNKLGQYILRQKLPNDGATYRLRAVAAGYDVVESTQRMPTAGILDSVKFVKDGVLSQDPFGGGNNRDDEFTFLMRDPVEAGNYYSIRRPRYYQTTTNTFPSEIYIQSLDKLAESEILSDKSFNGKAYSWRNYGRLNFSTPRGSRIEYTLVTSNSDLLQFVRSKELNDNARDNPFAEPVILYSNIKNGYGIFTLTTTSTWIKRF